MENKPLVSYVLTAYNIENFIEESVKCAFAQTYEPLEIILSDDCSTDKTFEIMKKMAGEYKGPHKVILNRNEKNLGITKHMNKAYLELAHGEIIVAAHGDDVSKPERVAKSVRIMLEHPECSAVSFSVVTVDSSCKPIKEQNSIFTSIRTATYIDEANGSSFHTPAPSRAFRKDVFTFFGPLQESCPTEDDPINFRALLLGTIMLYPDEMVLYRKHENSSSNITNFDKFPLDNIKAQLLLDLDYAVSEKIVDAFYGNKIKENINRVYVIRQKYRDYLTRRTIKSLIAWEKSCGFSLYGFLYAVREHCKYLKAKIISKCKI